MKNRPSLLTAIALGPDQVTHGTSGAGTIAHLAAELLNDAAKIQLKHVPYKGTAGAVMDAAAGTIDVVIAANTTFASQVQSGRLRQVAVTSEEPSPAFPGLATMASVVPGYSASLWTAVFAPSGTPPALVARLNREINEVAKSKALADLMKADGGQPLVATPEEAARRVRDSYATWKHVATTRNISVD